MGDSHQGVGMDLAELYRTGASVLPGAAQQLRLAYSQNPTYAGYSVFARPAGLGLGDAGPGAEWGELAALLDQTLLRNAEAIEQIGVWMVDFTQKMAELDGDVSREFKAYGGKLDRV